jgi:hypothetical protein
MRGAGPLELIIIIIAAAAAAVVIVVIVVIVIVVVVAGGIGSLLRVNALLARRRHVALGIGARGLLLAVFILLVFGFFI